jgi:hypothetical protein
MMNETTIAAPIAARLPLLSLLLAVAKAFCCLGKAMTIKFRPALVVAIVLTCFVGNQAKAETCLETYKDFLKQKSVFLAFATSGGVKPREEKTKPYSCGFAGRETMAATKKAALDTCQQLAQAAGDKRPCIVIESRNRADQMSKSDCGFVQDWYRKKHPGYTVLATSGGTPINSAAVQACTAEFAPTL